MTRSVQAALVVAAAGALAVVTAGRALWSRQGAVQRGHAVAEKHGCFACHGPGGIRGMADPGHELGDVPTWSGGLITMYAENEADVREWILDGLPARVRRDPAQMRQREKALILMPAYRGVLSARELDDVVAYVKAVSDLETPKEAGAEEGRQVALRMGCFNCHGSQGRGASSNPRAFKGYIPPWDGADFEELAQDEAEVREWILDGSPRRLRAHPIARWFMRRQVVQMPPYREHLKPAEVDRLVEYIRWVRLHPY